MRIGENLRIEREVHKMEDTKNKPFSNEEAALLDTIGKASYS